MKTWRKALRRLIKTDTNARAIKYPKVYRRLLPVELQDLTRRAWAEVGPKLTSVPRKLVVSNLDIPAGGGTWSHALMKGVVQ